MWFNLIHKFGYGFSLLLKVSCRPKYMRQAPIVVAFHPEPWSRGVWIWPKSCVLCSQVCPKCTLKSNNPMGWDPALSFVETYWPFLNASKKFYILFIADLKFLKVPNPNSDLRISSLVNMVTFSHAFFFFLQRRKQIKIKAYKLSNRKNTLYIYTLCACLCQRKSKLTKEIVINKKHT
jgi:hypothetical protein